MKNKSFFSLCCTLTLCLTSSLHAAIPASLLYQGKPIDALCFETQEPNDHTVSLKHCGLHAERGRSIETAGEIPFEKDFIGYQYQWKVAKDIISHGFSYYKPITAVNDSTVIVSTINNGGGTGVFTSLLLVKRKGDTLTLQAINGGDRCNGGIKQASAKNQTLLYGVHLTPFAMFDLAKKNPHHLQPYENLADCAACCVATAVYAHSLSTHQNDTLQYVDLDDARIDADTSASTKNYNGCFNRLLDKAKSKSIKRFSPQELNRFVEDFNDQCK